MKSFHFKDGLLNLSIGVRFEQAIFWSAVCLHIIIFFTVATDNNGDPNEYIVIARTLFSVDAPINPNRFIGYPLFLKISSLNLYLLNLTFFVQHVLFLFSLWFFANKITNLSSLKALIYLPALIPSIAYIPNLLFPDCLILSLLLFFSGYLYAGKFLRAQFFAVCLILVKLVFIFLPLIVLGTYVLKNQNKVKGRYTFLFLSIVLLGLIPSVYLFSPFTLYQSVVQKPSFIDEPAIATSVPNPFKFTCGKEVRVLSDSETLAKFTEHSSDLYHMPLGQNLVKTFKCSPSEVKVIQRSLVIVFFTQAPVDQIYKFFRRFVRNTFIFMDVPHVGYMLELKYQLMNSNFGPTQYYEKTQLEYFEGQGMKPLRPPGQSFLRLLNSVNFKFGRALSWMIVGVIGVGFLGVLVKRLPYLASITPLIILIIFYNFSITFFAFGYDRYIFINYFLWISIIVIYLNCWFIRANNLPLRDWVK